MTELALNRNQYLEMEKLALGAFAPVHGFMNEEEFRSVVYDMHLPDGQPFPLPIMLDVSADDAVRIKPATHVTLTFEGEVVGELVPESIFTCDKEEVAAHVFGTADLQHPGVRFFYDGGSHFIGGSVRLIKRVELDITKHELTPEDTKRIFKERGWKTIVGFQTRNVPHRAHEYLQRVALEYVDGLFVQPLVGRKKVGDYTADSIVRGYQTLIDDFFPKDRVVFGILTTSMRYAGPREAVFHAIIRRNYGCTHFIVGRDHAGVGDYYSKYAAHELTKQFDGKLGIKIMRLHGPYYCEICDGIVTEKTCPHEATRPEAVNHISGTDIRAMLLHGKQPDSRLIRQSVINSLDNTQLFVEDDTA